MNKYIALLLLSLISAAHETVTFQSATRRIFTHAATRLRIISPLKRFCAATSILGGGIATLHTQFCLPHDRPQQLQAETHNIAQRGTNHMYPGVTQIHDSLYVSKVADDFYLAIERIDTKNLTMWQHYATRQVDAARRMGDLKYLPTLDGSAHFRKVLDEYADGTINSENELWVAYASRSPVIQSAQLSQENPHLEMFVSVATSPKALLTSHMGISRTWEAAKDLQYNPPKRKKHSDQSLHLHSFAAKVMKLRNPERISMITAPTPIMRTLLLNKLPAHAISIGDSLYRTEIEKAQENPQTLLARYGGLERIPGDTPEIYEKLLQARAQVYYHHYAEIPEKLDLLKSYPPRIIRIKEGDKEQFIIQDAREKTVVAFNQNEPTYQWLFTDAFASLGMTCPYVMVDLAQLAAFGQHE